MKFRIHYRGGSDDRLADVDMEVPYLVESGPSSDLSVTDQHVDLLTTQQLADAEQEEKAKLFVELQKYITVPLSERQEEKNLRTETEVINDIIETVAHRIRLRKNVQCLTGPNSTTVCCHIQREVSKRKGEKIIFFAKAGSRLTVESSSQKLILTPAVHVVILRYKLFGPMASLVTKGVYYISENEFTENTVSSKFSLISSQVQENILELFDGTQEGLIEYCMRETMTGKAFQGESLYQEGKPVFYYSFQGRHGILSDVRDVHLITSQPSCRIAVEG